MNKVKFDFGTRILFSFISNFLGNTTGAKLEFFLFTRADRLGFGKENKKIYFYEKKLDIVEREN